MITMKNGKLPLRHRFLRAGSTAEATAEKCVDYCRYGGNFENVLKILEGKPLMVRTLRDFADDSAMFLESSGVIVKGGHIDARFRSVVLRVMGESKKTLKNLARRIKEKITVIEEKGQATTLVIELKANAFAESMQRVGNKSAQQVANECGITYRDALHIVKTEQKRKIPCSACASETTKIRGNKIECRSCSHQEALSKQKLASRNVSFCEMCGSHFDGICSNCGHRMEETVTASQVGNGIVGASGVYPASCPHCGGTTIGVGDSFKCLSCGENISGKPEPGENQSETNVYTVNPDEPEEIRGDEEYGNIEPVSSEKPGVLSEFAIVVHAQHAPSAYRHLLDNGLLPPGCTILRKSQDGWIESDATDSPDDDFIVKVSDQETAQSIHDNLASQGYSVELASAPEKKEKMAYPGFDNPVSTFDYEKPFPVAGESKEFSIGQYLRESIVSLDAINENLQKHGFSAIDTNKLNLVSNLYYRNIGMPEILQKTGLTEEAVRVIIGKE